MRKIHIILLIILLLLPVTYGSHWGFQGTYGALCLDRCINGHTSTTADARFQHIMACGPECNKILSRNRAEQTKFPCNIQCRSLCTKIYLL